MELDKIVYHESEHFVATELPNAFSACVCGYRIAKLKAITDICDISPFHIKRMLYIVMLSGECHIGNGSGVAIYLIIDT